jgi:F-type H+-transporting ATPase subunit b
MNFDLTTFVLESINFIILVWLLQHFLYRPVLDVIEKRRLETTKTIEEANTLYAKAHEMEEHCEQRLATIENERVRAKELLDQEIKEERKRFFDKLDSDILEERKRQEALEDKRRTERLESLEKEALSVAGRFIAGLFKKLASKPLNDDIAKLTITELAHISDEKRSELITAIRQTNAEITVMSAYELNASLRSSLTQALRDLTAQDIKVLFNKDEKLLAGLYITVGAWVLMSNLRDELDFFTETLNNEV